MLNKLWNNLDFAKHEAVNMIFHVLSGAPGSPTEGQPYYNSTSKIWFIWNGTAWIDPLARANHTGAQLANTISNFDTQVRTNRLDQMASPTASLDLNNQKIINLLTPTLVGDAVTKGYVDDLLNGTDWKASARVATTANITLSGLQTIDDISVLAGERVLVKDQTTASENGIYEASSGAWTRSADADEDGDLTPATSIFIEEGTAYADTQFRITTDGTIIIGTTNIVWGQIGAGVSYTAGNGIDITGSVISVDTTVVVRKASATIWDGVLTSFTITHNLNTLNVQITVREIATGEEIIIPTQASSVNQAVVEFATAPATDTYEVIIQG